MSKEQNEILAKKIENYVADIVRKEGCRLYDLEFVGVGPQRVLRVSIDRMDSQVSIDDCANVSRGLSELLDAEDNDLIPGGAYQLEVSSPGLERNLKKDWHFQGAKGLKVEMRLLNALGTYCSVPEKMQNAKRLEGRVLDFVDGKVSLEFEGGLKADLPMNAFEKIKTVFEVISQPKKKK